MEIPSCSITSAIACLISGRKNGEPQEVVLLKLIKEISRIIAGLSTTSAARGIRMRGSAAGRYVFEVDEDRAKTHAEVTLDRA